MLRHATSLSRHGHVTAKVTNLERFLSQVVRDFEREKEGLMQSGKGQQEELLLENTGLRQLVKLKNKELKSVRRRARPAIHCRTPTTNQP